jgi:hypothetical protein
MEDAHINEPSFDLARNIGLFAVRRIDLERNYIGLFAVRRIEYSDIIRQKQ